MNLGELEYLQYVQSVKIQRGGAMPRQLEMNSKYKD